MVIRPLTASDFDALFLAFTEAFSDYVVPLSPTREQLLDKFDGNVEYALAAYNAGPTLVAKVGPNATEEAIEYVATISKYYKAALDALS